MEIRQKPLSLQTLLGHAGLGSEGTRQMPLLLIDTESEAEREVPDSTAKSKQLS
jgi:hypothetical protein